MKRVCLEKIPERKNSFVDWEYFCGNLWDNFQEDNVYTRYLKDTRKDNYRYQMDTCKII